MENTRGISLPAGAELILNTLHQAGFEAFIVGGCVRDSLLGRTPGDWDITTSARPEEVKKLFRRTIDTGLQHGTVTVMQKDEAYEVTTYRTDGFYSDGRHPDSVQFVSSLSEDLSRRDFTINAMAYAPEEGLVDFHGGLADLEAKTIRAVGNPTERFTEDALRMLRAVRFSAQLGFTIEEATWQAIRPLASRLEMVSRERIRDELNKLLLSDHPDYFEKLADCGITAVIMPRFDQMLATSQHSSYHCYDVGHHTLKVMAATPASLPLRLTALLHDSGKIPARTIDAAGMDHFKGHQFLSAAFAEQFLKEYRYDNKSADYVLRLIRVHDICIPPTPANLRRLLDKVGKDLFPDYLAFSLADCQGKAALSQAEFMPHYNNTKAVYQQILTDGDPISIGDLAVNGGDLIAAGVRPGPGMGWILRQMLEDVQREPAHNTKAYLLEKHLASAPAASDQHSEDGLPVAYMRALELIRAYDIIILHRPQAAEDSHKALETLKYLIRNHYPEKSVYESRVPAETKDPASLSRSSLIADQLFPYALSILVNCDDPENVADPRWQTAAAVIRFDKKSPSWRGTITEVLGEDHMSCMTLIQDFAQRCRLQTS